jgi:hypothetical protein
MLVPKTDGSMAAVVNGGWCHQLVTLAICNKEGCSMQRRRLPNQLPISRQIVGRLTEAGIPGASTLLLRHAFPITPDTAQSST